ncbi:KilA-N domain-containing protein [Comamonas sp.]|uniref:KilA-N domain-containing protein n=1 Tax=Comamonas sp. TaxID=34028 RepID=UPI0028A28D64|nr:KilA-N domain-containing protein [Comamonas sp.]
MAQHNLALILGDVSVRQHDGLFSLNDLHMASGGEKRHQPGKFTILEQTKALIAELGNSPDSESLKITTGRNGGTYACRELVIAYAAWISPAFHLQVIRVFLDAKAPALPKPPAPDILTAAAIYKAVAEAHRATGTSPAQARLLADEAAFQQTGIRLLPPTLQADATSRIVGYIANAAHLKSCDPVYQALLSRGFMPHSKLLKLAKMPARLLRPILERAIAAQVIEKIAVSSGTAYVKA